MRGFSSPFHRTSQLPNSLNVYHPVPPDEAKSDGTGTTLAIGCGKVEGDEEEDDLVYFQLSVSNTLTRPRNWSRFSASNARLLPSEQRL